MFQEKFYFGLIRKYVTLFGGTFSNIYIDREDSNGDQIASIKVPIQYAPKEKMFTRLLGDPNLDRPYATLLPRMSFEITSPGFQYDPSRNLSATNKFVVKDPDNANRVKYQYNPVPYNIYFSLFVYVKNVDDGLKIIEQILPYFRPDWTPSVNLVPEMNDLRDIPIQLTSGPIMNDVYDGDFKTRRMVYWQINFTMKGYMFGPIRKAPIIKYANATFYVAGNDANGNFSTANSSPAVRIIVSPGQTANGQPTDIANNSVSPDTIFLDSDFGFTSNVQNLIVE